MSEFTHIGTIIEKLLEEWEATMPNKAAKASKQQRRKINQRLSVEGRTPNQMVRNQRRNQQRKGK
mgnify:CR=1 FL=1